MKTTIWYSVENGGDGSAYPIFYETEKLADWDQNQQEEEDNGWAEHCVGCLTIEHYGPMSVDKVITAEQAKAEMEKYDDYKYNPKKYAALIELMKEETTKCI